MSESFEDVRKRLKEGLEQPNFQDVAERRKKKRKRIMRLLYLGVRVENLRRIFHYADITKVFNHGLPLNEEDVEIRKYLRSLDRDLPGSISEYEYEIGPLGELQLLPKTRMWRGSWQNQDDVLRWQSLSLVNASKHRLAKTTVGYNEKIFGKRMITLRMIYLKLTPFDRLLFLARIIYHVTGGREASLKEEYDES